MPINYNNWDDYDNAQADLASNFGHSVWDADPDVCCAYFQTGACRHTESDAWEYEVGVGLDGDDFIFEEIKCLNENRIIWRTGHMNAYLALVAEDNIYPFNRLLGDMRGDDSKWLYRNDPDLATMVWDEPF